MGRGVIQRIGDIGEQGNLKIRVKKKHLPPPGLEGQREKLVFQGPEAGAAVACVQTTWAALMERGPRGEALLWEPRRRHRALPLTQSPPADVGDEEQCPGLSSPPAFQRPTSVSHWLIPAGSLLTSAKAESSPRADLRAGCLD